METTSWSHRLRPEPGCSNPRRLKNQNNILVAIDIVTDKSLADHQATFLASLQTAMSAYTTRELSFSFAIDSSVMQAGASAAGQNFCMCPSLNADPSGCGFSCAPTEVPTKTPTKAPTVSPTDSPTATPTMSTAAPRSIVWML